MTIHRRFPAPAAALAVVALLAGAATIFRHSPALTAVENETPAQQQQNEQAQRPSQDPFTQLYLACTQGDAMACSSRIKPAAERAPYALPGLVRNAPAYLNWVIQTLQKLTR